MVRVVTRSHSLLLLLMLLGSAALLRVVDAQPTDAGGMRREPVVQLASCNSSGAIETAVSWTIRNSSTALPSGRKYSQLVLRQAGERDLALSCPPQELGVCYVVPWASGRKEPQPTGGGPAQPRNGAFVLEEERTPAAGGFRLRSWPNRRDLPTEWDLLEPGMCLATADVVPFVCGDIGNDCCVGIGSPEQPECTDPSAAVVLGNQETDAHDWCSSQRGLRRYHCEREPTNAGPRVGQTLRMVPAPNRHCLALELVAGPDGSQQLRIGAATTKERPSPSPLCVVVGPEPPPAGPAANGPRWMVTAVCSLLLLLTTIVFCVQPRLPMKRAGQAANMQPAADRENNLISAGDASLGSTRRRVDTKALTGLRGIAAFQVAFGHHLSFSDLRMDGYGGAAMPFFYLLSGFVMAIGWFGLPCMGESTPQGQLTPNYCFCDCCDRPHANNPPIDPILSKPFDKRRFYINRFARLIPVYLLTNLAAIAVDFHTEPALYGVGGCDLACYNYFFLFRSVLTLFGLTSWTGNFMSPLNGVTWTISTMFFFYWLFPDVVGRLQRYTPDQLKLRIACFFWVQFFLFYSMLGPDASTYFPARVFPPRAFLVFGMGCMAALHRLQDDRTVDRGGGGAAESTAPRPPQVVGVADGDFISYTLFCGCCCFSGCFGKEPSSKLWLDHCMKGREDDPKANAIRADLCFGWYLGLILVHTIVEYGFGLQFGGRILMEIWVPPLLLALIMATTRDDRSSVVSRFCLTKPMQQLGEISMSFYMIHLLTWGYINWATGSESQWLIPISISLSLVLGWLVTQYFEKPVGSWIRKLYKPAPAAVVHPGAIQPIQHPSVTTATNIAVVHSPLQPITVENVVAVQ